MRRAARLAVFGDHPKHWDAWNVDRSYRRHARPCRVTGIDASGDGVEVRYAFGESLAVVRFSLDAREPFLRVECAVAWNERHALLRLENALAFVAARARFGSPHGAVERTPAPRTRAERAKYEAPGQRFARLDATGGGLAVFALDTYGWSLERRRGRSELGHSLLRGTMWPDPGADAGEAAFSLAYRPFAGLGMAELERDWERFSSDPDVPDVPMFVPDAASLVVCATKPADDGDGIVVRLRECDGTSVAARIRCGARAVGVRPVDALERTCPGEVAFDDGAIVATFGPYQLRSFRVRLA